MIPATEKERLLEALKENHVVLAACHKTGIGKSSYYRWRESDPEFAKAADDAIREGIELINDAAEGAIIGAIKAREVGASKFWLKHHHPAYATKIQIEPVHMDDTLDAQELADIEQVIALTTDETTEMPSLEEPNEQ